MYEMKIILFDGMCNLCNSSVQFIIQHDPKAHFHFTSQQSEFGKKLIEKQHLENIDSIIFIENKQVYLYSDAILEVCKELEGWLKLLYIFRFIPKIIRDKIYKLIATYRYTIFGKKESCMLPSKEIESRFLN